MKFVIRTNNTNHRTNKIICLYHHRLNKYILETCQVMIILLPLRALPDSDGELSDVYTFGLNLHLCIAKKVTDIFALFCITLNVVPHASLSPFVSVQYFRIKSFIPNNIHIIQYSNSSCPPICGS